MRQIMVMGVGILLSVYAKAAEPFKRGTQKIQPKKPSPLYKCLSASSPASPGQLHTGSTKEHKETEDDAITDEYWRNFFLEELTLKEPTTQDSQ